MCEAKKDALNIMDNKAFLVLHKALYSLFRELHSQGVGAVRKQAGVITVTYTDM